MQNFDHSYFDRAVIGVKIHNIPFTLGSKEPRPDITLIMRRNIKHVKMWNERGYQSQLLYSDGYQIGYWIALKHVNGDLFAIGEDILTYEKDKDIHFCFMTNTMNSEEETRLLFSYRKNHPNSISFSEPIDFVKDSRTGLHKALHIEESSVIQMSIRKKMDNLSLVKYSVDFQAPLAGAIHAWYKEYQIYQGDSQFLQLRGEFSDNEKKEILQLKDRLVDNRKFYFPQLVGLHHYNSVLH